MDQELARPAGPSAGGHTAPVGAESRVRPGAVPAVIRTAGALTAVLAGSGVALQLWLNITGDEHGYGPVGEALHLLSYFTITSNLVVGVVHVDGEPIDWTEGTQPCAEFRPADLVYTVSTRIWIS